MRLRFSRAGGFTLIEVLVSLAIFAFGSMSALALTLYVMNANKDAQTITEGAAAGRLEMERILGLTASTSPALDSCTSDLTAKSSDRNCWREVRPSPNGAVFQVTNRRQRIGNTVRVEVVVFYPSSRDLRATRSTDAGWKDCLAEAAAGRVTCHGLRFHGQKGNFQ